MNKQKQTQTKRVKFRLEFEKEKVMLELKQLFNHIIKDICGLT